MKTQFFNIIIDATDHKSAIKTINSFLLSDSNHTLFFLNAHCFNVAQDNSQYLKAINTADLLLNDGIGIKLASFLKGIKLKDNLNGTDLIPEVIGLAEKLNIKIYLLGGKQNIAGKATEALVQKHPGLQIAGYHSGYFSAEEENQIIKEINSSGAGLLIIGMGVPKQELWASKNKTNLSNVNLTIGGGAILDFISGNVTRAPFWMRKLNIEWVYRLFLEPRRLWKRYILGSVIMIYHIIRLRKV